MKICAIPGDAKSYFQNRPNRRRRGSLLIDIMLGMTLVMSLVGMSSQYMSEQSERTRRLQLATEQDALLRGARGLVTINLAEVREKLFEDAQSVSGGRAISVYGMDELSERGFLPQGFDGGIMRRHYGKEMALLVRAVSRNDSSNPKPTLTRAQLRDPDNPSRINPVLVDGVSSNDEMDFEAMLVSYGGTEIGRSAAGTIISMMETPFGGFMGSDTLASGAYGSTQVNTTPFNVVSERPRRGDIASIVALSSFDVLGDDRISDTFLRCEGMNRNSEAYRQCLGNNQVYTDYVIAHYDSSGNGTPDRFPALRGVTAMDCRPPGDGTATGTPGSFLIDCEATSMSGSLEVAGGLDVQGDDNQIGPLATTATSLAFNSRNFLERRTIGGTGTDVISADRVSVDGVNDGHDLAETILSSEVVRPGDLVRKPQCPARTLDGAHAMQPRIYLSPIEYADPYGRAIVGVRAFAEDAGANWRVRLMSIVAQDICRSDFSNPIPISSVSRRSFSKPIYDYLGNPNGTNEYDRYYPSHPRCNTWNSEGDPVATRVDQLSDVYELARDNAVLLAQARCY